VIKPNRGAGYGRLDSCALRGFARALLHTPLGMEMERCGFACTLQWSAICPVAVCGQGE